MCVYCKPTEKNAEGIPVRGKDMVIKDGIQSHVWTPIGIEDVRQRFIVKRAASR